MNKLYLFVFMVLFVYPNKAISYDRYTNYIEIIQDDDFSSWKKLLHYENNKSTIQDASFFLSPLGSTNPKTELEETIKQLLAQSTSDNNNVQCKFPARYTWIKQNLHLTDADFPKVNCSKLSKFREKVSAKTISLVFATEKANSPMSMMGHLFFKIKGKRDDGFKPAHSVSFFADFSKFNPLTFIPKSLTTGTDGAFILEPYSKKINLYAKKENRKLIEYDIKLSQPNLDYLVDHIWELKGVNINYNLRTQNCASALFYLLNIIDADYQAILEENFITPVDAINIALKKELIKNNSYNIKKSKSSFITTSFKNIGGKNAYSISLSPAYLDKMEDLSVFNKEAEISLFTPTISYFASENKLLLDELILYKSKTYIPQDNFEELNSTYFEVSLTRAYTKHNDDLYPQIILGKGIAFNTRYPQILPYAYLNAGYKGYNSQVLAIVEPEIGLFYYLGENTKLNIANKYQFTTGDAPYKFASTIDYSYKLNNNAYIKSSYNIKVLDSQTINSLSFGLTLHF
ncbi:MAG: DUF4105 domain-containing protein [Proteobacteria bacterium]|nr:DUF4105 domain-containing protein [Pseudomonadota bacterium]